MLEEEVVRAPSQPAESRYVAEEFANPYSSGSAGSPGMQRPGQPVHTAAEAAPICDAALRRAMSPDRANVGATAGGATARANLRPRSACTARAGGRARAPSPSGGKVWVKGWGYDRGGHGVVGAEASPLGPTPPLARTPPHPPPPHNPERHSPAARFKRAVVTRERLRQEERAAFLLEAANPCASATRSGLVACEGGAAAGVSAASSAGSPRWTPPHAPHQPRSPRGDDRIGSGHTYTERGETYECAVHERQRQPQSARSAASSGGARPQSARSAASSASCASRSPRRAFDFERASAGEQVSTLRGHPHGSRDRSVLAASLQPPASHCGQGSKMWVLQHLPGAQRLKIAPSFVSCAEAGPIAGS